MLNGIDIILYYMAEVGKDEFNATVYEERPMIIKNVLVSPSSSDDVTSALSMYGRKAVYTLAMPKGDDHNWENAKVKFFGKTWRTFGIPIEGIEDNIPLKWNKKVMVERYE